jgi:hypothetical protein
MAQRDDRKAKLTAELAQARSAITHRRVAVGEALDFKSRVRKSVGRNAVAWIGGAAVVGFLLSRLPARKTKVKVGTDGEGDVAAVAKTGLLMTVFKLAFDAFRPALLKVAMSQLQPFLEKAMERWQSRR